LLHKCQHVFPPEGIRKRRDIHHQAKYFLLIHQLKIVFTSAQLLELMPVAGGTFYVPTKINGQLIKRTQSAFFGHFFQISHVMTGITAPFQKKCGSPEYIFPNE
jgi:hypothetical protein